VDVLSPTWIQDLIQTYGLWVLFTLVTLESMGIPMPGETALVTTALYAGSTHQIGIALVVLVAATAAIIGDNLGYLIGRSFGSAWSSDTADTSDSMSRGSRWASICFCATAGRLSSSAGSSPFSGPTPLFSRV
jgi:membrane protein DedA with SNARE-associated domain